MSLTPILGLERDITSSTLTPRLRKNFEVLDKAHEVVHLSRFVKYGAGMAMAVRKANRIGFKKAYDLAKAHHKPLFVNPGVVEIEIDQTGDFVGDSYIGVRLDGDVDIIGAGMRRSRIKFFPDIVTFKAFAFYQGPGLHNSFSDLTISGPEKGSVDPEFYCIKHQGDHKPEIITDETLTLRGVKVEGEFASSVESNEGDLVCRLDHCDLTGYTKALGYFVNNDTHKQLIVSNCHFHDTGLHPQLGVLIYVSPGVSLDISGSRFSASTRFGVHINGSSEVEPLYSRITNNVFEESLAQAIRVTKNNRPIIQGNLIKTHFVGIAFEGAYLGGEVLNNVFIQPSKPTLDFQFIGGGNSQFQPHFKVHGNTFNASSTEEVGLIKAIYAGGPGSVWDIQNNIFIMHNAGMTGITVGTNTALAFIGNNKFTGSKSRVIDIKGGTAYIYDNIVEDGLGFAFNFIDNNLVAAYLDDNYVAASVTPLHIFLKPESDGKIRGSGNDFRFSYAEIPSVANFNYQMIQPKNGVCPTPIESKEETSLPISYDTFHISGNAAIKYFYFSHGSATRLFCGEIRVIFDEFATTITGGNIMPEIDGPRLPGRIYRFLYDPSKEVWYE